MKDSTNAKKPIGAPKIWRPNLGLRKPGRNDIDWSNLCEDQVTHLTGCTKSLNVPNSSYNHKKKVTHSRQDPLCEYHLPKKNTSKVGCCSRMKSTKMNRYKQHYFWACIAKYTTSCLLIIILPIHKKTKAKLKIIKCFCFICNCKYQWGKK